MKRSGPIPTWYFALVVVRRGDEFLLVQESKRGQRWYLPAGRIELGESFVDGAIRETREEAGISVRLTGIYRIEHTPRLDGTRVRVLFAAEPLSADLPKHWPDEHSLQAAWFGLDQVAHLSLRGPEVLSLLGQAAAGAPLHSLSILGKEG